MPLDVLLFSYPVHVYIVREGDLSPSPRQLEVLTSLPLLPAVLLEEIAVSAADYCRRVDSVVNLANEGISVDYGDITRHYRFTTILIPELGQCESNYMFISADCDWEDEHGMEIFVADGRVIRCDRQNSLPFSGLWKKIIDAPAERRRQLLDDYTAQMAASGG